MYMYKYTHVYHLEYQVANITWKNASWAQRQTSRCRANSVYIR